MRALVTGASGFIGGNLARQLVNSGYQTRVLLRRQSDTRCIADLDVEPWYGDLRDAASLEGAVAGCDILFHVAASYTFWAPNPKEVYEANVGGTRNVLLAARAAGIERIVYTSTESTIGIARQGELGTEAGSADYGHLAGAYKRSKLAAEQLVLRMCAEGLPAVIVNPTTPIGPGDLKPTPTGQIIVNFLRGRMPAFVNTGLNFVDVADVAKGHILAAERGRVGERYILGNRNLTLREFLGLLAKVTERKAPALRIPLWLALTAAYADEYVAARAARRPPGIPVAAVRTAGKLRYFDCTKAVQELGLPQTSVEESLIRAVRWFRQNGYV